MTTSVTSRVRDLFGAVLTTSAPRARAGFTATGSSTTNVLDAVANLRRVYVLEHLAHIQATATGSRSEIKVNVDELATHVAARHNDRQPTNIRTSEQKTAYNTLIQSHLPKLDDMELITYHEDSKTVTPCVDCIRVIDAYNTLVTALTGTAQETHTKDG